MTKYITKEEAKLLRVLEASIRNATTVREVKEAKSCIADLFLKILERAKKDVK